jgi:programmed cell death 6-interacting protein
MSELITIPLKKPTDVDVTKTLKNIISSAYNDPEKKSQYNEKISEFNKLRASAIWKCFEKFESSLELISG